MGNTCAPSPRGRGLYGRTDGIEPQGEYYYYDDEEYHTPDEKNQENDEESNQNMNQNMNGQMNMMNQANLMNMKNMNQMNQNMMNNMNGQNNLNQMNQNMMNNMNVQNNMNGQNNVLKNQMNNMNAQNNLNQMNNMNVQMKNQMNLMENQNMVKNQLFANTVKNQDLGMALQRTKFEANMSAPALGFDPDTLKQEWSNLFKEMKGFVKDAYREVGSHMKDGKMKRGKSGMPIAGQQTSHLAQLLDFPLKKQNYSDFNDLWNDTFTEEKIFLAVALHPKGEQHRPELIKRMKNFRSTSEHIYKHLNSFKSE